MEKDREIKLRKNEKKIKSLKKQLEQSQKKEVDLKLELEELKKSISEARKRQEYDHLVRTLDMANLKRTFERKMIEKDVEMMRMETFWKEKIQSLEDSRYN